MATINCIICGNECVSNTAKVVQSSASQFKLCLKCVKKVDPESDFAEIRKIIESYLSFEKKI